MKKSKQLLLTSLALNILLGILLITRCADDTDSGSVDTYNSDQYSSSYDSIPHHTSGSNTLSDGGDTPVPDLLSMVHDADPYLKLIDINSRGFLGSELQQLLRDNPDFVIYILIKFKKPASYEDIVILKNNYILPRIKVIEEYLDKDHGIFYCRYKYLIKTRELKFVENVYLLTRYTAQGHYKLNFKTELKGEVVNVQLSEPVSKPGRKRIYYKPNLSGKFKLLDYYSTNNILNVRFRAEGLPVSFFAKLNYVVDLKEILLNQLYTYRSISRSAYINSIKSENADLYFKYTQETTHLPFSDFVNDTAYNLKDEKYLGRIYDKFTRILEAEVPYDFDQRRRFFGGQITYTNFYSMYMPFEAMRRKASGCCPERRPFETAVLRRMGIPARITIKATHIFSQIYMPGRGWIDTVSSLNDVPLAANEEEKMSYFIKWSPDIPFRVLVWEGALYPKIVLY